MDFGSKQNKNNKTKNIQWNKNKNTIHFNLM